ncbi:hypothetical protein BDK51DRAFT_26833 [Blyttiomyces helicus]|uniref:SH3 domain-containing protein n=1 Tax=Blyttiomyces helicus TaxID=388810 RepID=A0A4V1IRH2_9FUNG|nr:hypothetical protein BDK51DRAFT_26833 [Blyttiomyces helicus]|eukprot:RKO90047.1 hypothetical protein BDK51DRAFT_26833 [Blyttiomyces helicus]
MHPLPSRLAAAALLLNAPLLVTAIPAPAPAPHNCILYPWWPPCQHHTPQIGPSPSPTPSDVTSGDGDGDGDGDQTTVSSSGGGPQPTEAGGGVPIGGPAQSGGLGGLPSPTGGGAANTAGGNGGSPTPAVGSTPLPAGSGNGQAGGAVGGGTPPPVGGGNGQAGGAVGGGGGQAGQSGGSNQPGSASGSANGGSVTVSPGSGPTVSGHGSLPGPTPTAPPSGVPVGPVTSGILPVPTSSGTIVLGQGIEATGIINGTLLATSTASPTSGARIIQEADIALISPLPGLVIVPGAFFDSSSGSSTNLGVAVGVPVAGVAFLAAIAALLWWRKVRTASVAAAVAHESVAAPRDLPMSSVAPSGDAGAAGSTTPADKLAFSEPSGGAAAAGGGAASAAAASHTAGTASAAEPPAAFVELSSSGFASVPTVAAPEVLAGSSPASPAIAATSTAAAAGASGAAAGAGIALGAAAAVAGAAALASSSSFLSPDDETPKPREPGSSSSLSRSLTERTASLLDRPTGEIAARKMTTVVGGLEDDPIAHFVEVVPGFDYDGVDAPADGAAAWASDAADAVGSVPLAAGAAAIAGTEAGTPVAASVEGAGALAAGTVASGAAAPAGSAAAVAVSVSTAASASAASAAASATGASTAASASAASTAASTSAASTAASARAAANAVAAAIVGGAALATGAAVAAASTSHKTAAPEELLDISSESASPPSGVIDGEAGLDVEGADGASHSAGLVTTEASPEAVESTPEKVETTAEAPRAVSEYTDNASVASTAPVFTTVDPPVGGKDPTTNVKPSFIPEPTHPEPALELLASAAAATGAVAAAASTDSAEEVPVALPAESVASSSPETSASPEEGFAPELPPPSSSGAADDSWITSPSTGPLRSSTRLPTSRTGTVILSGGGTRSTEPRRTATAWNPQLPSQQPEDDDVPDLSAYHPPAPTSHVVATPFAPIRADEMPMGVGDLVGIEREFADGWCRGQNITHGRRRGLFPLAVLTPIKSGPSQSVANVAGKNWLAGRKEQTGTEARGEIVVVPPRAESLLRRRASGTRSVRSVGSNGSG